MESGRFWPRPFLVNLQDNNFVISLPFELEGHLTHQNDRNGHIYIQVMKQHMP